MGEGAGVPLVAGVGDALESQVVAPGPAEGGVVRRRDVLRGMGHASAASKRPRLTSLTPLLQISTENLLSFATFSKDFCQKSFSSLPMYKDAIFQVIEVTSHNLYHYFIYPEPSKMAAILNARPQSVIPCLQLAAERCSKSFSEAGGDREKELKLMLDWAIEGFLPTGPRGFAPAGRRSHPSPPD